MSAPSLPKLELGSDGLPVQVVAPVLAIGAIVVGTAVITSLDPEFASFMTEASVKVQTVAPRT